jgi:hypothetical protein
MLFLSVPRWVNYRIKRKTMPNIQGKFDIHLFIVEFSGAFQLDSMSARDLKFFDGFSGKFFFSYSVFAFYQKAID